MRISDLAPDHRVILRTIEKLVELGCKFAILPVEWTEGSGHLTPKMSIKRGVIMSDFADDVDALYAACQDELIQHEATSEEMGLDAEALGIPAGKLIPALQALWDLEKEYALRKAAVLRKYKREEKE